MCPEYDAQRARLKGFRNSACPGDMEGVFEGGPVTIQVGFLFGGVRIEKYGGGAEVDVGAGGHCVIRS